MAYAICLKSTGRSCLPLRELWTRFGRFEKSPSMAALNYPPHITLAIYNAAVEDELRRALHLIADDRHSIVLTFNRVSTFAEPEFVIWAAPDGSVDLEEIFIDIHRIVGAEHCHGHYRPGNWVPHVTLAMDVSAENLDAAKHAAGETIEPFVVIFDAVDLVEFSPIRIVEKHKLRPSAD